MKLRNIKAEDIESFIYHYLTAPQVSIPVIGFVAANIASVVCGISDGYANSKGEYSTSYLLLAAATNSFSTGALARLIEENTRSMVKGSVAGAAISGLEYTLSYAVGYGVGQL